MSVQTKQWKFDVLANIFKLANGTSRVHALERQLIGMDATCVVARSMSERQREIYFWSVDIAMGGGFDYHGGTIGGGSMNFSRMKTLRQQIALYVGNGEGVNIAIMPMRGARSYEQFTEEQCCEILAYGSKQVEELVRAMLRLKPDEQIELTAESCVLRVQHNFPLCVLESDFRRIRSHLAMALDLCDEVERFAATLT